MRAFFLSSIPYWVIPGLIPSSDSPKLTIPRKIYLIFQRTKIPVRSIHTLLPLADRKFKATLSPPENSPKVECVEWSFGSFLSLLGNNPEQSLWAPDLWLSGYHFFKKNIGSCFREIACGFPIFSGNRRRFSCTFLLLWDFQPHSRRPFLL